MAVEDGRIYNPNSNKPSEAFACVNLAYPLLGESLLELRNKSQQELQEAGNSYFTAAIAYLANCTGDSYLEDVATTAWWVGNQGVVSLFMPEDVSHAVTHFGVSEKDARKQYNADSGPFFFIESNKNGIVTDEHGTIIMPKVYLHDARTEPIAALALTAKLASQMRDLFNGREDIDQNVTILRTRATEAHFLHNAYQGILPSLISEEHRRKMEEFPHGINSLAPRFRYKGMNPTAFQNAALN